MLAFTEAFRLLIVKFIALISLSVLLLETFTFIAVAFVAVIVKQPYAPWRT